MVILGHNLGNSQVSVYRTIGPTLVLKNGVKLFEVAYLFVSLVLSRFGMMMCLPSFDCLSHYSSGKSLVKHAYVILLLVRQVNLMHGDSLTGKMSKKIGTVRNCALYHQKQTTN